MMLLAILFPGISFLLRGKFIAGIIAVILQTVAIITLTSLLASLVGFIIWLKLAIWAVGSMNNSKTDERLKEMEKSTIASNIPNSKD